MSDRAFKSYPTTTSTTTSTTTLAGDTDTCVPYSVRFTCQVGLFAGGPFEATGRIIPAIRLSQWAFCRRAIRRAPFLIAQKTGLQLGPGLKLIAGKIHRIRCFSDRYIIHILCESINYMLHKYPQVSRSPELPQVQTRQLYRDWQFFKDQSHSIPIHPFQSLQRIFYDNYINQYMHSNNLILSYKKVNVVFI